LSPASANLRSFETDLEQASLVIGWLRPLAQFARFQWLVAVGICRKTRLASGHSPRRSSATVWMVPALKITIANATVVKTAAEWFAVRKAVLLQRGRSSWLQN
jgi:hypothetical protein